MTEAEANDIFLMLLLGVFTVGIVVWKCWLEEKWRPDVRLERERRVKEVNQEGRILKGGKAKVFKDRLGLLVFALIAFALARYAESGKSFTGKSASDGINLADNPILFPFIVNLLYLAGVLLLVAVLFSFFRKK